MTKQKPVNPDYDPFTSNGDYYDPNAIDDPKPPKPVTLTSGADLPGFPSAALAKKLAARIPGRDYGGRPPLSPDEDSHGSYLRLPLSLAQAFRHACKARKRKWADVVRELMTAWLAQPPPIIKPLPKPSNRKPAALIPPRHTRCMQSIGGGICREDATCIVPNHILGPRGPHLYLCPTHAGGRMDTIPLPKAPNLDAEGLKPRGPPTDTPD